MYYTSSRAATPAANESPLLAGQRRYAHVLLGKPIRSDDISQNQPGQPEGLGMCPAYDQVLVITDHLEKALFCELGVGFIQEY